jgi:hypothetical protein
MQPFLVFCEFFNFVWLLSQVSWSLFTLFYELPFHPDEHLDDAVTPITKRMKPALLKGVAE